ncbi:MAG TPA: pseudouridine synthase [Acidobacteriota bacterium]|nr:pseudouridine synthase [Acidobacteriota bacterium]
MSAKLQLHQFLSKTGKFASKLDIMDAIHDGMITVDDKVVTDARYQLNPNMRTVVYNGEVLSRVENIYIALHKPMHNLCSRLNNSERSLKKRSVFEIVSKLNLPIKLEQSLFTVGRLDEDTTGLLLVTNDGDFCHKVINAGSHIPKVYLVTLRDELTDKQHRLLKDGVDIELEEDGKFSTYHTRPAKLEIDVQNRRILKITIDEGKKRQIRSMFEAVGNEVVALCRISIGELTLASLRLDVADCVRLDERQRLKIFGEEPVTKKKIFG